MSGPQFPKSSAIAETFWYVPVRSASPVAQSTPVPSVILTLTAVPSAKLIWQSRIRVPAPAAEAIISALSVTSKVCCTSQETELGGTGEGGGGGVVPLHTELLVFVTIRSPSEKDRSYVAADAPHPVV